MPDVRRHILPVFLWLLCGLPASLPAAPASSQAPVFETGFETPALPANWRSEGTGSAVIVALPSGSRALSVSLASPGNHLVSIPLPLDRIRGLRVTFSGRTRAEDVGQPPKPWQGVKFMLHTRSPGGPGYQAVMELHGSFDWKPLGLSAFIPPDASEAFIILGLEETTGRVWFDDVSLTVSATPRMRPVSAPALLPPEKLDRRSDLPRLRGVMYGPRAREEDIRRLAEWNANLIRWQFYWHDGTFPERRLDLARYDRWLEETMEEVDRFLPLCEELGIRVVIDLHTPPGAGEAGQWAMFAQADYQQKFIEVWDRLVARYKDQPAVWGYDLVNEPVEGKVADGLLDWRALADVVARRVRAADPKKAIIIEPGPHGGWGNLPFFEPLAVPGVVYSVHMYEPLFFTHQGVLGGMPAGVTYPGMIGGEQWNIDKLRQVLAPVRDYQRDYNVPVYVGEFSAPRWAPDGSAARYLRDCIAVFEEYGWDWSYHAFREWHGWNVELVSDQDAATPSPAPTDRERALREGFARNARER